MAKKSIAKNYLYNLVYQILTLVLPLITTPYLSRVLGAEGIGIYSYTYAIVTYFILFGSLGVSLYGQREIAYAQDNTSKRKKTFFEIIIFRFVTIFISIGIYAFVFMKSGLYSFYYRILFLELLAAAFDISWFFQGMEDFKRTVMRNILVRVSAVTLVFILVKNQNDLSKFILIYSAADFIGNLTLWFYLPKYFKGVKVEGKLNVMYHLVPILLLFVPQIANQIYKILDTTMIGKLVSDKTETGYYEQGQKVIRLLLTVVTSLGTVMVPRMANTFATGDKKKISSYMKMSFNFTFFLAFPITFGIISISSQFVPVFFGANYDKVATLIVIISPILLLMGIANVIGTQYLLTTKRQKEFTISIVIGVIFNFIMNYFLIKSMASIGASIATVLSQLIVDIVQLYLVKNDINLKDMFKNAWKYLISALIMFAVCFGVKYVLNLQNIVAMLENFATGHNISKVYLLNSISIVVQMMFGVITYMGLLLILKDEYVFMFINKMKSKFLGKKDLNKVNE